MIVSLTIAKPDHEDEVFHFEKPTEITVGRSSNCTICLDFDAMVSRMHAVLLIDPPSVRIKDLNSTNGLVINGGAYGGSSGEKLLQPRELRDGDEVMIGTTLFRVDVLDSEDDPRAATLPATGVRPADRSPRTSDTITSADDLIGREAAETIVGPGVRTESAKAAAAETVSSSLDTLLPVIPGYRIRRFLGAGRIGTVYLAQTQDSGERVAVKIMVPDIAFTRKMIDDFNREIGAARRLEHPHIARIIDSGGMGEKSIYLIAEYVNGEDLGSYLARCRNRRLPLYAAYNLMLQVTSAMGFAHSRGFVHLDFNPQSVMLTNEKDKLYAKVDDIGVTKCLEDSGIVRSTSHYSGGDRIGYMPPEQLAEFRDFKPTLDVFSLAAVFYQMLTGSVPYHFSPEDTEGDRLAIVTAGDIVPIEERLPSLPESLVVIIDRALSVDPEERYRNCGDLMEALENVRV